jgi:hypothetical protein
LWQFQTKDNRSIRKALDFMAPYVDRDQKWPYQQIARPNRASLALLLLRAEPNYPDAHYQVALSKAGNEDWAPSEERLLFKLGPIADQTVPSAKVISSASGNN